MADADTDSKTSYRPVFLHPDEKGTPETTPSVDQSRVERDTKPSPGSYMEYEAELDRLRLLAPYLAELKKRLGNSCYVLQFKSMFDMDAVPNEFRRKDPPLLWKIKMPGVRGWVTDRDHKTFYFPSREDSLYFLKRMRGEMDSPGLDEVLETRDNLDKLLW